MKRAFRISLLSAVFSILCSTCSWGAVLVMTDFNSAINGSGYPNFPQLIDGWGTGDGALSYAANAGPAGAGDYAAYLQMAGAVDKKVHFMTGNILNNFDSAAASPYDGNYTALGVQSISFDVRHGGAGSDLALRVHLWDADHNLKAVTTTAVTLTKSDTTWHTYTLSLKAADLVSFGSGSIAGILNDVTGISIRNTPTTSGGTGSGPALDAATSLYIDNIKLSTTAVPEPSSYALFFGAVSILVVALRRKLSNLA